MKKSIKSEVKNFFSSLSFNEALVASAPLKASYIDEYGIKSWNSLVAYYKKANNRSKVSVAEPEATYKTSLMQQYEEMKKKYPDAILLFRIGDFYEMFGKDAVEVSEVLGITLTRRMNGKADPIELTGFPHHYLDTNLPKLVRAGKRVAICEQLEDSKKLSVK